MSVSELESRPGYRGGGLEVVARDGPAAGAGGCSTEAGAGAASGGRTLLSTMSLLPLMSPLLLSSSVSSSGCAMFSWEL